MTKGIQRTSATVGVLCALIVWLGFNAAHAEGKTEFVPEWRVVFPLQRMPKLAEKCAAIKGLKFDGVWIPRRHDIDRLEAS